MPSIFDNYLDIGINHLTLKGGEAICFPRDRRKFTRNKKYDILQEKDR
jgi:hypothetical protein